VVIALVVTPDGFPLAYEVYPGNTADSATLRDFLSKIESQHGGKVRRTWLMDRGIFVCLLADRQKVTLKNISKEHAARNHRETQPHADNRRAPAHHPRPHHTSGAPHQSDRETTLLLHKLGTTLPDQPPPKILPTGEVSL
jgi:hypothetical protein